MVMQFILKLIYIEVREYVCVELSYNTVLVVSQSIMIMTIFISTSNTVLNQSCSLDLTRFLTRSTLQFLDWWFSFFYCSLV